MISLLAVVSGLLFSCSGPASNAKHYEEGEIIYLFEDGDSAKEMIGSVKALSVPSAKGTDTAFGFSINRLESVDFSLSIVCISATYAKTFRTNDLSYDVDGSIIASPTSFAVTGYSTVKVVFNSEQSGFLPAVGRYIYSTVTSLINVIAVAAGFLPHQSKRNIGFPATAVLFCCKWRKKRPRFPTVLNERIENYSKRL